MISKLISIGVTLMSRVYIVTDSTADLTEEEAKQLKSLSFQ